MVKTKYLILGAGPSGLTFAAILEKKGITDYIMLEKEETVGGLCRSELVDECELDIGGGHFLDVRDKDVNDFLFEFMPESEWNLFKRNSKISLKEQVIDHPIEAHIWQMDMHEQVEYLKSIANAGCNLGKPKPDRFIDWIYWKLGTKIADEYMLPYNKKMFGSILNDLGTYWLEKLPNVSFEETLMSCLERKMYGKEPGHAYFYYPKSYGYGEVWRRMGKKCGNKLRCNEKVMEINTKSHIVKTSKEEYLAEKIIVTIPWDSFRTDAEDLIKQEIRKLRHVSIAVCYKPERVETDAHWIYCPDLSLPYHRILVRHNFLIGSRGHWTETNVDRMEETDKSHSYINEYAYPLNTSDKPQIMQTVLEYFKAKGVYGLGRWGEHQHYNSDVCVKKAMEMAVKMLEGEI